LKQLKGEDHPNQYPKTKLNTSETFYPPASLQKHCTGHQEKKKTELKLKKLENKKKLQHQAMIFLLLHFLRLRESEGGAVS